jgi:carboxypeptidase family protein
MRSGLRVVALVVGLFLLAGSLAAQTGTTSLRGVVFDAKGAVLPGATVTISDPQNGLSRTTKTNGQGEYQFLQLPPATYAVAVDAKGFATVKQEKVELLVAVPSTLNFTMQVQGQAVTVEVSGETTHVNTTDATMGNAFNSNQIEELPFEGRNPVEMLSLQAGVTYTNPTSGTAVNNMTDTRSGAVNGGRSDQANITLDGIDNNDQENGFAFTGAVRSTLDSVEEFRVTTTNSNADEGRSSGAQVQLVTKSGTNSWHGSAYELNRSNIGEANDWFNENSQISSGLPNIPPFLRRNTFGAALGGPIKRDRLFFFANWEKQIQHESTETTRIVPSMNLRAGSPSYWCINNGPGADPNCIQGNTGINGASITIGPAAGVPSTDLLVTMAPGTLGLTDPNCYAEGVCPLGPGANPAAEGIMGSFPPPNQPFATDSSTGISSDGYNYQGYNFPAPTPLTLNTYIAKLDYNITQNGNHRIFVRGIMNGDRADQAPEFPNQPPSITQVTVAKSLAVGYTAVLTNSLINNFHYGLTRQAVDQVGGGNVTYLILRGIDNPGDQAFDSYDVSVPVHNFIDDVSWTRSTRHTIGFGANLRLLGNIKSSYLSSFSDAVTNASWLNVSGIANKGTSLDPGVFSSTLGLPAVDPGFNNSWDYPVLALAGIITEVDQRYNFTTSGATLPNGAPNNRHFVNYEFETYVQDSWRARPNLTITYGLRWTLLQPPYEKNGVQVAPTFSLNNWYNQRSATMVSGQSFSDPITFGLAGNANGKPSYWGYDYKDFAPRFAIAFSPGQQEGWLGHLLGGPDKTSIRLGAGMYYDHFGQGVVNTFDQSGSFGLSTLLTNTGGVQAVDGVAAQLTPGGAAAPRMGTVNPLYTLPPSLITPSPGAAFPVTYPLTNFAVQWGLDDKLKTPYSYAFNLSLQRELGHNFTIETAYVGRLGFRLLQQEDLAQPRDISDPASHTDYYAATRQLDNLVLAGTPENMVAPIPYWENLFGATSAGPAGASHCAASVPRNPTATQNMYDLMACGFVHNETTFQQIIDGVGGVPCFPGCITLGGVTQTTPQYYSSQFASLYAWRSIGNSYYDAGQLILRHAMTHGLQFDLNYTYAHSIDMGSDAERIGAEGGLGDQIYNAWDPALQRASSTFDTRHQINSNWVFQLPYGRGRAFGSGAGRIPNSIFGGWDLTGVLRWTSGFPVSVGNGAAWATNWELSGYATQIGPTPSTGVTIVDGEPNMFKNYTTAVNSYRQDFPGEVGNRNDLRGPGYFDTDMGLHKMFNVTERQTLQFRWEVYNAFNSVRFDVQSANISPDVASAFGFLSRTLTIPRRMEFGARYTF